MKKKINRITEAVFNEIHSIRDAMPGLTAKTVAEILIGRGAVEGIGVSTVNAVLRFPTFEEYKRYNESRTMTGSAAAQAKAPEGQTEIELPIEGEEKPRMSEAARTMIGNQERIIHLLMELNSHITEIGNFWYSHLGKIYGDMEEDTVITAGNELVIGYGGKREK